jgi:hypothetical protein
VPALFGRFIEGNEHFAYFRVSVSKLGVRRDYRAVSVFGRQQIEMGFTKKSAVYIRGTFRTAQFRTFLSFRLLPASRLQV